MVLLRLSGLVYLQRKPPKKNDLWRIYVDFRAGSG